jgi:uncharacterized repeat protein (TIGR04044 family)
MPAAGTSRGAAPPSPDIHASHPGKPDTTGTSARCTGPDRAAVDGRHPHESLKEYPVAQIIGERAQPGDAIVDYEEKLFDDIQAQPGEKAYIFMHTVPFEGSVGLVNMLTCTRINRKGFDTTLVLYGPGVLMASATRGFPTVGTEAFPGNMAYNNQLRTFMNEGGKVLACRFAMAALYGMRETDLIEGVQGIHALDVLDVNLTARREGALVMQTWTL